MQFMRLAGVAPEVNLSNQSCTANEGWMRLNFKIGPTSPEVNLFQWSYKKD